MLCALFFLFDFSPFWIAGKTENVTNVSPGIRHIYLNWLEINLSQTQLAGNKVKKKKKDKSQI